MTHRRKNNGTSLSYSSLERRQLLTTIEGTFYADEFVVKFEGGVPVLVEFNGDDIKVPDGFVELIPGRYETRSTVKFEGDSFRVTQDGDVISVNDVVTISDWDALVLETDDGDDTFDVFGANFCLFGCPIVDGSVFRTGGGNDVFVNRGGQYREVDLGPGDDVVLSSVTSLGGLNFGKIWYGGDGNDEIRWDSGLIPYLRFNDDWFASGEDGHAGGYAAIGFEKYVAAGESGLIETHNRVESENVRRWVVDGNETRGFYEGQDDLTLVGFNSFRHLRFPGGSGPNSNQSFNPTRISVLATDSPVSLDGFGRVEVGFDAAIESGDLSGFQADLEIGFAREVAISNYANANEDLHTLKLSEAGDEVTVETENVSVSFMYSRPRDPARRDNSLVIHGSRENSNRFDIEATSRRTVINGSGQRDVYFVGGETSQDLEQLGGRLLINGNGGGDYVFVNDQQSGVPLTDYRANGDWIGVISPVSNRRKFAGVWFNEVDRVAINGNANPNHFYIQPSTKYNYLINQRGILSGDEIRISGTSPADASVIELKQTIWFGVPDESTPFPIRYGNIADVPMTDRLVGGSQLGQPARVEVLHAVSGRSLLQFDPFPNAPDYRGGLTVATGEFNGDGIDDVVVGLSNFARSHVAIFSGIDGTQIGGFEAFEEDYRGGIDIAVGNVTGDGGNEIVVSKLQEESDVRVFSVSISETAPFSYELLQELTTFPVASEVGSKIAVANIGKNKPTRHSEVVSVAQPGWLPQIAAYSLFGEPAEVSRFLANKSEYRGRLTVEVGALRGGIEHIMIGFREGSQFGFRTYRGTQFPGITPDEFVRGALPFFTPFQTENVVDIAMKDTDNNDRVDQVFATISGKDGNRSVQVFDSRLEGFGLMKFTVDELSGGMSIS